MCERCGNVGKHRWIDYLLRFRMNKISVFLRDKCYKALRQAARARLGLFREYRDIQSRATLRASRESSMNLRRAAALALVGWYLMEPPMTQVSGGHSAALTEAPLGRWNTSASFDNSKSCVAYQLARIDQQKRRSDQAGREYWLEVFSNSLCIASDDSRLKEK